LPKFQFDQKYFALVQTEFFIGAVLRLHLYLSRPKKSINQNPTTIPSKLHPKTSTITWSHQHYLKLFNVSLNAYSTNSKATEEKIINFKSLQTKVLKNHPKACASAKRSKNECETFAHGSYF
jgi:hypothetical protein